MFNIPEWSDIGNVSPAQRSSWEGEIGIREHYRYYYDGLVFKEKVPQESGLDEDAPLLYPVGINLVKMLCLAMADSEFGEWEERCVNFEVRKDKELNGDIENGIELLNNIFEVSNLNSTLWEIALDRNIYGAGVMKVSVDLKTSPHIRWSRVPLQSFYPVFDPDDPFRLLEAYVVTSLSHEQARLAYTLENPTAEIVQRVEHWTPSKYDTVLDGKHIDAYSGQNPYGFVPFVFVPRFRSNHEWGDSLTEDVIPVQDELNMRVADLGEAINYNSHPVRYGYNLPRALNTKNFPLDANAMWDLGRTIGNSPVPTVGLLEAKNPLPEGTFKYINFLYDWTRTSSFAPPIAFGDDNGGGQRSGLTLEIRMWPLVKSVRRSRSYMAAGIRQAMRMSALMLRQKAFSEVPVRAITAILADQIVPTFAPVLPKDHQAIVDEVVKRMSTTPPTISLQTAVEKLGDGVGEVDRIQSDLKNKILHPDLEPKEFPAPEKSNDVKEAQAGKDTPQAEKAE